MRTFFKDNNKIVINSMDYTEVLVTKQFMDLYKEKEVKIEERKDVNDDLDGIIISLDGERVNPLEKTFLRSATDINTAKSVREDEANIRTNAAKCSVEFKDNKIIITDEGLIEYIGGNIDTPKKWVGLLVDMNTKVVGSGYTIEDIDYEDAKRWGASNDTTFVMWLTTEKSGVYTFTNVDDATQKVDLIVEFK